MVKANVEPLPRSGLDPDAAAMHSDNAQWDKGRMLQVQYHGIKPGAGLETWRGMDYQTVLTPSDYKTGDVIYPYERAKM